MRKERLKDSMWQTDKIMKKSSMLIGDIVSNNKEAIRFIIVFLGFSLLFFIIFFVFEPYLDFLKVLTAQMSVILANSVGLSVTQQGISIIVDNVHLEIIHECTGIFIMMIASASILAYPTDVKKKGLGIVLIIPLILILNLSRLLILIFIGKHFIDLFEYVHSYLWQGTFIIFIIFCWFLWIELVVHR